MGQKPPVQAPQPDPTAWIKTEDQSLATNKAAVAVPFGAGEHKTVGAPITDIYGWNATRVTAASGKGGKGGAGQTTTTYRGTIAYSFGIGPGWSLEWMLVNGARAFDGHIAKVSGEDYVDINLEGYGPARWYWGTETQVADPLLVSYEDATPAYRGKLILVLRNCSFGPNGETQAPTIEACWRRIPQQSIIDNTGGSASNDGAFTANGIAVAAEVFTGWDFMGRDASAIDATSWQATADALQAMRAAGQSSETDSDRSAVSLAPLWTERTPARSAFVEISRGTNAWFRQGSGGKIEAGYWKRTVDLSGATDLGPDDVTEIPEPQRGDAQELKNSFIIEYTDSTRHHKSNCITVNNTADIRNRGLFRQTLKRPDLLREYQARIAGNEARRDAEIPDLSITLKVKRRKAKNPDGSTIRPGDYFRYPVRLIPTEPENLTVFRCVRREFDPIGDITLIGELEKLGSLAAVVPDVPEVHIPVVMPPAYFRRIISLRWENYLAINSPIFALVARPDPLAIVCRVLYGEIEGGDFQDIGAQPSYALPVSLPQAVAAADSTVRVKLLPLSAAGANPRRDSAVLTDWQGGTSEGRDDTLLLILLSKSGGAIVTQEICSINGPATVVATDTYDVPVLRGRRWSTATAFSTGSFPDAFASYEGWIIRRDQLEPQFHSDFLSINRVAQPTIYIRYTPVGLSKVYDGTSAFAEYERRTDDSIDLAEFEFQIDATHQPTDPFTWPATRPPITNYTDLVPEFIGSMAFSHREVGGLATLIGFSPYSGPVYTKFLTQAGGGTFQYHNGADSGDGTFQFVNDTLQTFNPVTGIGPTETPGHGYHYSWLRWDCAGSPPSPSTVAGGGPMSVYGSPPISGSPTSYESGNSSFFGWGGCDAGLTTSWGYSTGNLSWTLSNEDTTENAQNRLEASLADIETIGWSPYAVWPDGGSNWSRRGSGITFNRQWGQFRIEGSGFTPDTSFLITVMYQRTDTNTAATNYFTTDYEVTADGSGEFDLIIDVPDEEGFRIRPGSASPTARSLAPEDGTPDTVE